MFTSELTERQQKTIRDQLNYFKQCYEHYRNHYRNQPAEVDGPDNLASAKRWLKRYGRYTRSYLCNHTLVRNVETDELSCVRCRIIVE